MKRATLIAAGAVAALAAATPASAADLYGDQYDRGGYQYDDGRQDYSDNGYDDGRDPGDDRYAEPPYGYRGSTKDGDYLPPPDHRPRFSEERRDHPRYAQTCAAKWQIKKRLTSMGWRNFERVAVKPRVVVLRAERPNGRAFELKLDRCSGEILAERLSRVRGYGYSVYGPGPRRYGWAY